MSADGGRKLPARAVFLENDIHDASDGVGTVLRCGAFQQHFHMIDRPFWYKGKIGSRTSRVKSTAGEMHQAGIVAAVAIHQDQRVVWGKTAKRGGERQVVKTDAELLRRKGWHSGAQRVTDVGSADVVGERVGAQNGNGGRAIRGGHSLDARTGHDDYFR